MRLRSWPVSLEWENGQRAGRLSRSEGEETDAMVRATAVLGEGGWGAQARRLAAGAEPGGGVAGGSSGDGGGAGRLGAVVDAPVGPGPWGGDGRWDPGGAGDQRRGRAG